MAYSMNFKVELPVFKKDIFDIRDYGAVEGGIESNTKAIEAAIAAAYDNGGGRVVIPAGIWLSGPVRLRSNIELHLEAGAVLLFDKNKEEYPLIITDYEGVKHIRAVSPLSAENCENIGITGDGVIDGQGHLWRVCKEFKFTRRHWDAMTASSPDTMYDTKEGKVWFPTKTAYEGYKNGEPDLADEEKALELAAPYYDFYRPVLADIKNCDKVLIEGVTLQNSPAWNLHPIFCTNVTIRNACIRNEDYAQNGDGLDLESCSKVEIYGVKFSVGDDAICMKSGKNEEARKIKVPTEDVYIHDCVVYKAHGGFVIGSEMSRGVRRVRISNCVFMGTDVGIRFKSAIGRGGVVEDIDIDNIRMMDITGEAIIFTMGYSLFTFNKNESEKDKHANIEDIPEFKNIRLNNIKCTGSKYGLKIEGLEEMPVHDIFVNDTDITAQHAYTVTNAENIILKNVIFRNAVSGTCINIEDSIIKSGDKLD